MTEAEKDLRIQVLERDKQELKDQLRALREHMARSQKAKEKRVDAIEQKTISQALSGPASIW